MNFHDSETGRAKEYIKWVVFLLFFTMPQLVYVYSFFIEPNWIQVKYVKIASPKISRALSGIRTIQISDLHVSDMGFREVSLIERINELKPDIVFITGDMVASREGVSALWNVLSLLEPKFRTYAIYGESDGAIGDMNEARQWDETRTSVLEGKSIRLNVKGKEDSAFWLAGAPSEQVLTKAAQDASSRGEPCIVLSHRPDIVKLAALRKIDLVLAGHTHGGQVGIALLQQLFPYARRSAYIAGLYKVQDTLLYVNSGIASEKGIRFLRRPEVTVFDFVAGGTNGQTHFTILPQDT